MVDHGQTVRRRQETQRTSKQNLPNLPETIHVAQSLEEQLGCRDLLLGPVSQQPQATVKRLAGILAYHQPSAHQVRT
jgi:hypothetical protein